MPNRRGGSVMPRFNFDRYQRPGRGIFLYMKSHPAIFNSIAVIMGVFIFFIFNFHRNSRFVSHARNCIGSTPAGHQVSQHHVSPVSFDDISANDSVFSVISTFYQHVW